MSSITELVQRHAQTLADAVKANAERTFHAHWPEPPSGKIYGETANDDGLAAFNAQLNSPFGELGTGNREQEQRRTTDDRRQTTDVVGEEQSPYGFALGITYSAYSVDELVKRAGDAQVAWQSLTPEQRASVLIEALERASKRFFEIGYATMHTTGQGFVMAFQSSGPHGFDRALEALALGYAAQTQFVPNVSWTKPMGKISVTIEKSYRLVPKGINVVIGCSTFPVWNTTPGMFAGLVTGNSVIIKPHPGAVYPIAIIVAELRKTLADAGLDPNICQLAPDTIAKPITLDLIEHPAVRVIDYTGGPHFGMIVEDIAAKHNKVVFTEKAGVNSVIIDSVDDLDASMNNLAFSLALYAGQMCTAPQNIYIPKDGVRVGDTMVSVDDVIATLVKHVDAHALNEKSGAGTVGTIQNPATLARVEEAKGLGLAVVRNSETVAHPGYADARSATPLILKASANDVAITSREWFGPISFVITTDSFAQAVELVSGGVRSQGALTTLVYTTDDAKMQQAEDAIVSAGAPVAFNFNSFVWVNQSAAFSDFHGAGANPAGNASFADMAFVANRFNVIGVRRGERAK